MTTPKKQSELLILRQVFSKKRFPRYTETEEPDFILHTNIDFGVEVVEYYPDETVARLHNSDSYADKVIAGNVHKEDRSKLTVVNDLQVLDKKTQKWKDTNHSAVLQDNRSPYYQMAVLVQLVRTKSLKYLHYKKDLRAIDMVIFDSRASFVDGVNDSKLKDLLDSLTSSNYFSYSGFRNIYFVIPPYGERLKQIFILK